ncbi:uncharacterized protein [Arachis hypogaea]|uniref:uncharacterized protein n=1 Tax=Arachis hypogaea TaxID=3818 RepID=UPI003B2165E4
MSQNNQEKIDVTQSPSSPYYIHPSETPSTVLVSPPLTGDNYHQWSRAFSIALISKNKIGFLDGTIPTPATDDPLFPSWRRCNTLVSSWIFNSLSAPIAQSVIYFDYAEAIWEDLRNRFSQGDLLRVAELQEQIYGLKQESLSVTQYHTALRALWEEHDTYCPVKPYICPARSYHDQNFIIRFLKGLDDYFTVVRSQILLIDPLPPESKVFNMVIQHERQLQGGASVLNEPISLTNAVITPQRRLNPGRGRGHITNDGRSGAEKVCVYCGGLSTGHTVDECYGKHDYPPGHPRYPGRPRFNDRSNSTASYTNATAANPNSSHQQLSRTGSSKEETYPTSGPSLSQAQYQSLLALLHNVHGQQFIDKPTPQGQHGPSEAKSDITVTHTNTAYCSFHFSSHLSPNTPSISSHNSGKWILDSGATDHICSSLSYFQIHHKINLIHDAKSLKMIGSAELRDGLYYLADKLQPQKPIRTNSSTNLANVNNFITTPITDSNVWHCRLGHLSDQRLRELHHQFPFINPHVNEFCDVCHMAKQK